MEHRDGMKLKKMYETEYLQSSARNSGDQFSDRLCHFHTFFINFVPFYSTDRIEIIHTIASPGTFSSLIVNTDFYHRVGIF